MFVIGKIGMRISLFISQIMDSSIVIDSDSEDDKLFEQETEMLLAPMPQLYCKKWCLTIVRMFHIRGPEFELCDVNDIERKDLFPLACEAVAGLSQQIRVLKKKLNRFGRLKQRQRSSDDIELYLEIQRLKDELTLTKKNEKEALDRVVLLEKEVKKLRKENERYVIKRDASPKRKNR